MFPELGQVDLIERVGHGVIVEQVVGLFLVGHKSWHSFQQEIEVIGAPIGVGGENRGFRGATRVVAAFTTSRRPPRENPVTRPMPESKITTPATLSSSAR